MTVQLSGTASTGGTMRLSTRSTEGHTLQA